MLMRLLAATALIATSVTPTAAMQNSPFQEIGSERSSVAAGAYFRIPLGGSAGRPRPPELGLRVSAVRDYRDSHSSRTDVRARDVVDLRLTGMAKPTLLIAGQPATGLEAEAANRLSTGGAIAIGGGVLLLLVLLAVASGGGGFPDTCPTIEGRRDHCID